MEQGEFTLAKVDLNKDIQLAQDVLAKEFIKLILFVV